MLIGKGVGLEVSGDGSLGKLPTAQARKPFGPPSPMRKSI